MVGLVVTLLPTSIISRHGCRRSKWSPPSKWCSADGGWCGGGGAVVLRQGGDPALGETFRSPSKFTRGLNPTPSFSPKAETLALPWWSRSQGTRSHATPRRARCYPVSARYSTRTPTRFGRGFVRRLLEMDLLPARRLKLSKSCLSSPVPARWPALGRRAYTYMCMVCEMCVWCMCG